MNAGIKDAINGMDYNELMGIKIDLEGGGMQLRKLVTQKIKEKEKLHEKRCAVCSSEIDCYGTGNYTLLFGPEDFKKKASFCAIDCLEYFLSRMKETRGTIRHSERQLNEEQ